MLQKHQSDAITPNGDAIQLLLGRDNADCPLIERILMAHTTFQSQRTFTTLTRMIWNIAMSLKMARALMMDVPMSLIYILVA